MAYIVEYNVEIDTERLQTALGPGRNNGKMNQDAEWAVDTVNRLIEPKFIYDIFKIEDQDGEKARLFSESNPDGEIFTLGPKKDLLTVAELVMVGVVTLGPALDDLQKEEQESGRMLRAYVLDTAAVLALGLTGRRANEKAEAEAAQRGWGVGRRLSPGDLTGWEMSEQIRVCSLLPIDQIGLSMTASGMLKPMKSGSTVVGMGPAYEETKVGNVCKWCPHQKSCPLRRLELAEMAARKSA